MATTNSMPGWKPAPTISAARLLAWIKCELRLAATRWALHEIDPMHPDVPRLVLHAMALQDQRHHLIGGRP